MQLQNENPCSEMDRTYSEHYNINTYNLQICGSVTLICTNHSNLMWPVSRHPIQCLSVYIMDASSIPLTKQ